MSEKERMLRHIGALSFAAHELNLFLDTHPESRQAMTLLEGYRRRRDEAVAAYEQKYGKLIANINDSGISDSWEWINDPWPWEREEQ